MELDEIPLLLEVRHLIFTNQKKPFVYWSVLLTVRHLFFGRISCQRHLKCEVWCSCWGFGKKNVLKTVSIIWRHTKKGHRISIVQTARWACASLFFFWWWSTSHALSHRLGRGLPACSHVGSRGPPPSWRSPGPDTPTSAGGGSAQTWRLIPSRLLW